MADFLQLQRTLTSSDSDGGPAHTQQDLPSLVAVAEGDGPRPDAEMGEVRMDERCLSGRPEVEEEELRPNAALVEWLPWKPGGWRRRNQRRRKRKRRRWRLLQIKRGDSGGRFVKVQANLSPGDVPRRPRSGSDLLRLKQSSDVITADPAHRRRHLQQHGTASYRNREEDNEHITIETDHNYTRLTHTPDNNSQSQEPRHKCGDYSCSTEKNPPVVVFTQVGRGQRLLRRSEVKEEEEEEEEEEAQQVKLRRNENPPDPTETCECEKHTHKPM
ncbi:uncharacterized protein AKAME5_002033900 [Lates japonicus]|uniref:Uncharacterized protein n=1 Tax=Lates japonicus TaxID=270547 RepID=A0AAD3NA09_LATJO|nr:uncharacterized protein AKAME5_002033900 [Lates japonicus]